MPSAAPEVFPVFRSAQYAAVLEAIMSADAEMTQAELATRASVTPATISKVVAVLERSGIITVRTSGARRLIAANTAAPFYRPLRDLIEITMGPPTVLAQELTDVAGISEAYIFGSWAARLHQQAGPSPQDIDVLIVGQPDISTLHTALEAASSRLRRPVNPRITSNEAWQAGTDAFTESIRRSPLVPVAHDPLEATHGTPRFGDDRRDDQGWEAALLGS